MARLRKLKFSSFYIVGLAHGLKFFKVSWYVLNSKKNSYPKIFVKIPSLTPWIQQNMLTYTNERNNMDDVDDVHVRQNYITLSFTIFAFQNKRYSWAAPLLGEKISHNTHTHISLSLHAMSISPLK